jgi:Rho-binding antiterminator
MEVIDGIEYLVLDSKQKIRLDVVLTFNGKRHREE